MTREHEAKVLILIVILIFFVVTAPLFMSVFNWAFFGKFTEDPYDAQANYTATKFAHCEWGITGGLGGTRCTEAPCKRYNIDELECVYEGYTGSGVFGMTDFNTRYYSCKGYGRVAERCVEHWSSYEEVNAYWEAQWNET